MIEYRIYRIYANAAYDHLHQIREMTDMWIIIKTECRMVTFDSITRIGDVMELKFQTSDSEAFEYIEDHYPNAKFTRELI